MSDYHLKTIRLARFENSTLKEGKGVKGVKIEKKSPIRYR